MEFTILTGEDDVAADARRTQLLAAAPDSPTGVERIDVAADGGDALVDAARAVALFGGARVVWAANLESITEANAAGLAAAADFSDAVIVARCTGRLPAKVKKALDTVARTETFAPPRGKAVGVRIEQIAAGHGVRLPAQARALLVEHAGDNLARVDTICRQLAASGLTRPSVGQVQTLLGSAHTAPAPWTLSDHLEAGRLADALAVAAQVEPVPTVAYLASRLTQAGKVVESDWTSTGAVQAGLGVSHAFVADKVLSLAGRLGPNGVRASWALVAAADREVKVSRHPHARLALLLTALAPLWGPRR